jgi:hypothetical protein
MKIKAIEVQLLVHPRCKFNGVLLLISSKFHVRLQNHLNSFSDNIWALILIEIRILRQNYHQVLVKLLNFCDIDKCQEWTNREGKRHCG